MNDFDTAYGIQLCQAVKLHKCLYDRRVKPTKAATTAAWKKVAKQCKDQASTCRFRWTAMRASYTKSYKKLGANSDYYLHSHLTFLIPHLDITPGNDEESLNVSLDDVSTSLSLESNEQNNRETTPCVDVSHKPSESPVVQNETVAQPRHVAFKLNETVEVPSPERRLRERKVPKRLMDADLSPERSNEKRPRRIMTRRKSIGGSALKEMDFERTLAEEFMYTPENENNTRPKPHFVPNYPNMLSLPYNDDEKSEKQEDNHNVMELKKVMVDSYTNTEIPGQMISVGNQCELELGSNDYNGFLESVKAEMSRMNSRQSFRFMARVYNVLMDVLDDGRNFPDNNVVIEAASAVGEDFSKATNIELRLIREFVSSLQAVKSTPEFRDIRQHNNTPESSKVESTSSSPAQLPTPTTTSGRIVVRSKSGSLHNVVENKSNNLTSCPASIATRSNPMVIKRSLYPKSIEMVGPKRPTVLTQDGEGKHIVKIIATKDPIKTLQSASSMGTQASTTMGTLPPTVQQRRQTATACDPLLIPAPSQQRIQPATTTGRLSFTSQQRPLPSIANGTLSGLPQQRLQASTSNGNLLSTSQQKIQQQPPVVQIPSGNINSGAKIIPNRNSVNNTKYKPYLSYVLNRDGTTTTQRTMLPPNSIMTSAVNNVMTFAQGNGVKKIQTVSSTQGNNVNKTNNMQLPQGSGINKPNMMPTSQANGPAKIISRRYSVCGSALANQINQSNQPLNVQNNMPNPPYKRIIRTPPPLQMFPNNAKSDEFNSLLHMGPPQEIFPTILTSASNTIDNMQLSNPVSLNTESNQNTPVKIIPAINYNCRPRMAEPLPQPVNFEVSSITDARKDAVDNLPLAEAAVIEMAGTLAADNFSHIFDEKSIKNEPEY